MAKLPILSSTEVVKMFQQWGWQVARGTLRTLIARAELTVEEFLSAGK